MKKGFTLAEILIAMAIVGIVASITIPTLVKKQQNQKMAATLGKAINTMSNSISIMISKDGAYGLNDSTLWADMNNGTDVKTAFKNHLGKILIFTDEEAYTAIPKTLYGVEKDSLFDDYTRLTTKAGINYFIKVSTEHVDNDENDVNYEKDFILADILVDVNGNETPNMIGRDIYGFLMTNEGRMIPYGGINNIIIDSSLQTTTAGNNNRYTRSWEAYCPDASKTDTGFCCTKKVISENYKINY